MANSDKRQRQKENARAAREAREAALKRSRRTKALIRLLVAAVVVAAIAGVVALVNDDETDDTASDTSSTTVTTGETTTTTAALKDGCVDTEPEPVEDRPTFDEAPAMTIDPAKSYTATIATTCGDIVIALDAENAPIATNNFVFLAKAGFYDGLTWHRVVPDFVIQGGDPAGDGTGGVDYDVAGEVPTDNYPVGSLAAAKTQDDPAGTMGSQFFVVTGPNGSTLPNEYARFGTVTEGIENAQLLESYSVGDGPPTRPLYIFSVEISES
ncbi:MAG TPA: peptidylprolyl isomerase [Acidimicrobiia bacterium]|nr:peptidylprolyl isomerase [Acidimicrobiia bacterium]